jgi:hypothetical protein
MTHMGKVRFIQVQETLVPAQGKKPQELKLLGLTKGGRLLERYNTMPPGKWGEIERPDASEFPGEEDMND